VLNNKTHRHHSRDLRKGRSSIPGQSYHVIYTTIGRKPLFSDFISAREVIRSIRKSDESKFSETTAFVVMPDHVRWLFSLRGDVLSKVITRVKSSVSRSLSPGHTIWQAGFYDHAIRRDETVKSIAAYIINNPIRAKMVDRIEDYSHWYLSWI
jgi:putative transposase